MSSESLKRATLFIWGSWLILNFHSCTINILTISIICPELRFIKSYKKPLKNRSWSDLSVGKNGCAIFYVKEWNIVKKIVENSYICCFKYLLFSLCWCILVCTKDIKKSFLAITSVLFMCLVRKYIYMFNTLYKYVWWERGSHNNDRYAPYIRSYTPNIHIYHSLIHTIIFIFATHSYCTLHNIHIYY